MVNFLLLFSGDRNVVRTKTRFQHYNSLSFQVLEEAPPSSSLSYLPPPPPLSPRLRCHCSLLPRSVTPAPRIPHLTTSCPRTFPKSQHMQTSSPPIRPLTIHITSFLHCAISAACLAAVIQFGPRSPPDYVGFAVPFFLLQIACEVALGLCTRNNWFKCVSACRRCNKHDRNGAGTTLLIASAASALAPWISSSSSSYCSPSPSRAARTASYTTPTA